MVLSAEQWRDRAFQARRLANVAAREDAQRLRSHAEECDIASALTVLNILAFGDEPSDVSLSPMLVFDASSHKEVDVAPAPTVETADQSHWRFAS
jgi:hypothetical protein